MEGVDPQAEALKPYTTCDVSDALVKLQHPQGGFLPGLTLWSPRRQAGDTTIVGPAYTVRYDLEQIGDHSKRPNHFIDNVPAGSVIFISSPPSVTNAVYGGMLSTRAQMLKAAGTIVDGRIRDLQEHRDLGFPVFARDIGTAGPRGAVAAVEINKPIVFEQQPTKVVIEPGDFLVGDSNGVVWLPKDMIGQVTVLLGSASETEARMLRDIKRGQTFQEAASTHRSIARDDTDKSFGQ